MADSDDDWLKDSPKPSPGRSPGKSPGKSPGVAASPGKSPGQTGKSPGKTPEKSPSQRSPFSADASWRAIAREILKDVPPKPKPLQHWARPRCLQYDYLFRYMESYYDDVIEYLDKKARGIPCEPPKPQTWAERALRTQTHKYTSPLTWRPMSPDPSAYTQALLHTPHWANTWHSVHSKGYYNRKYKDILFGCEYDRYKKSYVKYLTHLTCTKLGTSNN